MKYIVGIDEVGRGPLAGPVTVCTIACEEEMYRKLKRDRRLPPVGKDSKKLSPFGRETYAAYLKELAIPHAIVHISNKTIDRKGISYCIKKAILDCIKKLKLNPARSKVLLDGGLRAPAEFKNQKTVIKGDEKEKIIAWASILAKVDRDGLMRRASKKFLPYGFHIHKGYATAGHRLAIHENGLSAFHRKTFCTRLISAKTDIM